MQVESGYSYTESTGIKEEEEISSLDLQPVLHPKVTRSYPSSVTGIQKAEDDVKSTSKTVGLPSLVQVLTGCP